MPNIPSAAAYHYARRTKNRPKQIWLTPEGLPVGPDHIKGAVPVKEGAKLHE